MVIFGALHVVALALGVMLFMLFLRSDSTSSWKPPEDEEGGGGGGNDRLPSSKPKPRPTGGVPLPDAEPSRTRLRDHSKLARRAPAPAAPAGASAAPRRTPGAAGVTGLSRPPSSAIGSDSASSSTPPPVSGPSRRTRTHWTTGSDVARAPRDARGPDPAGEREPRARLVVEDLDPARARAARRSARA